MSGNNFSIMVAAVAVYVRWDAIVVVVMDASAVNIMIKDACINRKK